MTPKFAQANGLSIAYYDRGPKSGETILFIQGLGTPSISWPEPFLQLFLDAGYRVITFDNRDMGKSSVLDEGPQYHLATEFLRSRFFLTFRSTYTLSDMKDDTLGLMDALDIETAHVVGISMGGMIAQLLACHHQDRILSLTSIMSTTGYKGLKTMDYGLRDHMMKGSPSEELADRLAYNMKTWSIIGSPDFPMQAAEKLSHLQKALEYGVPISGTRRQLMAIVASPDRRSLLQGLMRPALIIHGDQDPLVPVDGGIDTDKHCPNSRLEIIKGMAHDLPEQLFPKLFDMMSHHIKEATVKELT